MEKVKVFRTLFVALTLIFSLFALSVFSACDDGVKGTFKINYVLNGGINDEGNVSTYDSTEDITLYGATRTGYNFEGWYTNESFEGEKITVISKDTEQDITVYAKWSAPNSYNIMYHLDGGLNNPKNPSTYTAESNITLQKAEKDGWSFVGWYDASGGKGNKVTKIAPGTTGDINLYAKWGEIELLIIDNGIVTGVTEYGEVATELTVPSLKNGKTVTQIANNAFDGLTRLQSITLPDTLQQIGNYAFRGCSGLIDIVIPENVISIGVCAFQNARMQTVTFKGNLITIIPEKAFQFCTNLLSVNIPSSVEVICEDAFAACNNLTSITIPKNVQIIKEGGFALCDSLRTLTFEEGSKLTNIGKDAFCNSAVKTITLPKTVTTLGEGVFWGCDVLESFVFEEGTTLQRLPKSTFFSCGKLKSINIPASVETIGAQVFLDRSLETVYINNNTLYKKISDKESLGYLVYYAKYVYVDKASVDASSAQSEFLDNEDYFTRITVNVDGTDYYLYARIPQSDDWNYSQNTFINEAEIYNSYESTNQYVYVLKSIVDDPSNSNAVLNNTSKYVKISVSAYSQDYYLYIQLP